MNKVLEKNFKKHCKIALLSYLSKIDCNKTKTLVSACEIMAERVLKRK